MIALRGGLGAGKTVFAKGVARGLGIEEEVTSPTFTIISEYQGRLPLRHIDAYRLDGPEDFSEIGGDELLRDETALSLIEWSERLEGALPPGTARLSLEVLPDGSRRAVLESESLEELLS